jgi:hypothetical protein
VPAKPWRRNSSALCSTIRSLVPAAMAKMIRYVSLERSI